MVVQVLRPTSFTFDNDTKLLRFQVAARIDCERMPLKLRNAWHIYEQNARRIVTQTYRYELESNIYINIITCYLQEKENDQFSTWAFREIDFKSITRQNAG